MASSKTVQKVHIDKLQVTLVKLEQLEEKPKEELSVRESIYFLRDKLRSALKKGYTYQDLSEILAEQEILVSAATLKQYLTESSKEVTKSRRSTKVGQAKQVPKTEAETKVTEGTESKDAENKEKQKGEKSELEEDHERNKAGKDGESSKKNEENLSEENKEQKVGESQQDNRKTERAKQKKQGSSNTDLSSEFNQY